MYCSLVDSIAALPEVKFVAETSKSRGTFPALRMVIFDAVEFRLPVAEADSSTEPGEAKNTSEFASMSTETRVKYSKLPGADDESRELSCAATLTA